MAINTTTRQTTAFTSGNNFAFAFKVYEVGDVKVIQIQTSNGAETVLTITTNYTVTLNDDQDGNPGGTVTLVSSGSAQNLASGYNIVITSKVSALQQTEITNQGGFFPEVINDVFDKAVILDQQQQSVIDKSIRFPITQTVGGLEITENAATRANKTLVFDGSGDLSVSATVDGRDVSADGTKLDTIETNAKDDQTAAEIRALTESATDSNVFTDADHTKLNAIEASATADQTASEIRTLVESATDSNVFTDADHTKLNAIEASATADQTGAEIKTAYEAESNTNAFTDAEKTKLSGVAASANNYSISSDLLDEDNMASNSATKAASQQSIKAYVDANAGGGSVNSVSGSAPIVSSGGTTPAISITAATTSAAGSMSSADKTKLDGVETNATADQSNAEIKTAYEANSNTNAFTDAEKTKLSGVEASATADQTASEIKTLYLSNTNTNEFTDAFETKLAGIEASADVTDATNVNAAGAVMNSDLDGKGELLVGDGSGDPTALAAGTNGYVLKANSSTATGLEWSAAGSGGDVNQNAFSTIAVSGQDNVAADSATDTLNIAAGSNVTVTTNAGSDTVTISSTDTNTTYSVGDGGLSQNNFTDALKTKLDGIAASANVGLTDLVGDTTPQLGGNLDVQAREITTSTTNGNIVLNPNGEFGVVRIKGDSTNSIDGTLELRCSSDSHGVKIKSPPHSAAQNYTLTLPSSIVNGAFLKTDSNGGLSFATPTDTNTQLSNAEVRTAVEAASDSNVFTDADHTKLNGIAASANNYVHPNHSGEVTSTADGATVIADDVVDEANLKVSNTPTNGYVLTAQSGNTGGLTWAAQSGGSSSTDSYYNTFLGTDALDNVDSNGWTKENVAIGYHALTDLQSNSNGFAGFSNVAIGYLSLQNLTTGFQNTYVGSTTGIAATTAYFNTVMGYYAHTSLTTGSSNTAIGNSALFSQTTSSNNVALGKNAGQVLTTGANNTFLGTETTTITTGSNNSLIGYNAAASSATVSNEITLGDTNITKFRVPGLNFVIKDSTATDNYVLTVDANGEAGWEAAAGGGGGLTSDSQYNTVGGTNAGDSFSGTSAEKNTLIGYNAGTAITTGDQHTYIGYDAGASYVNATDTGGSTAVGFEALKNATVTDNTAVGDNALKSLTTGAYNVAFGSWSQRENTTGTKNTSLGAFCGQNLTTGQENVFIGFQSANNHTTGNRNTFIGKGAGAGGGGQTGDNNICIGYEVDPSAGTSNEITLGDSNITKFRIPGINVVLKDNGGTPTNGHVLTVDANGEAGFAAASGGGGGGLVYISTQTVSSATTQVEFDLSSSSYDYFVIKAYDITFTADVSSGSAIIFQFFENSYSSSSPYTNRLSIRHQGIRVDQSTINTSHSWTHSLPLTVSNWNFGTDTVASFNAEIGGKTNAPINIVGAFREGTTTTAASPRIHGVAANTSQNLNYVIVGTTTTTFASGKFALYGIVNS